jgi:RNA polymerase sigma-70 factor (ECF subfamily)
MPSNRKQVSISRSYGASLHRLLLPVVDAALRRVITTRDQEYEDLIQSALEAVFVAMCKNEFRGDSSVSTWASTIARNVAIDALRARARERRVFDHPGDTEAVAARSRSAGTSPEQLADVREQLTRFYDALWKLSPTKAQVVYLHDVLGHRLEEVALSLGISIAAAQSRLVRGRRQVGDLVVSVELADADPRAEEPSPPSGARRTAPGKDPNHETGHEPNHETRREPEPLAMPRFGRGSRGKSRDSRYK